LILPYVLHVTVDVLECECAYGAVPPVAAAREGKHLLRDKRRRGET